MFQPAAGAIDRLAGENTRKKLEHGLDSVAQQGAKWLQRFK